jgi:hypothetical protein
MPKFENVGFVGACRAVPAGAAAPVALRTHVSLLNRRQRGDASPSRTATSPAESHTSTTRHVPAPGTGRPPSPRRTPSGTLTGSGCAVVVARTCLRTPLVIHSIDSIPTDHGWFFLLAWRRSARQAWVGAPSGETSLAASPSPASHHRRDIGSPCGAATGDLDCTTLLRA